MVYPRLLIDLLGIVFNMMTFGFKIMTFASKLMNFALKMMGFALKMMDFSVVFYLLYSSLFRCENNEFFYLKREMLYQNHRKKREILHSKWFKMMNFVATGHTN